MSATPSDEEIRRRLEGEVMDDVLRRLGSGQSRSEVIDALVADGFERAAAGVFVERVRRSPEGTAARRTSWPWRRPRCWPG
jgi:cytochrome c-type biogenesis protein CcmH/NrfF